MSSRPNPHDFCMLTSNARRWPPRLDAVQPPPGQLLVRGVVPTWSKMVAVVGTRASDPEGESFAYALGAALNRAGFAVLSGGARGIDTAAHLGSVSASGETVAVLATGLSNPYPRSNRALFEKICERGALVSEVHGEVPPHPGRFLRRNQLVAGLARLVVVVQAPQRSGALSTARAAKRLGRPVLVVPAAPWDIRGRGSLRLIAEGAEICTDIRSVLRHPALAPGAPPVGMGGSGSISANCLVGRLRDGSCGGKAVEPVGRRASEPRSRWRSFQTEKQEGGAMAELPTVLSKAEKESTNRHPTVAQHLRRSPESDRQRARFTGRAAGLVWNHWRA